MLNDNKTWEVYSSILSEEGIDFVYSKTASTAYFDLEKRKVTVPVWEWMDEYAKQLLVSHEVGHAKFSDYELETYEEYVKEFKDLFNVVEDARIERLMKKEYLGLNNIFLNGYKVLIKNNIFEIPENLGTCNLTERLNLYAKIGTCIEIPFFNGQEHTFAYRLMNLNTKSDVVSLCYDIKEYIKEHQEENQEQQSQDGANDDGLNGENRENSGEISNSEDTSQDADSTKKSENKNNIPDKKSGSNSEDKSDIDKQLTDNISSKINDNIEQMDKENRESEKEKENKNSNDVDYFLISVDTKSYDRNLFDYSKIIAPIVKPTLTQKFYKTSTKMVKNLAQAATNLFKQKMSANENAMIRNKTVGKLDMKKVSRYAVSDNIFRNIKMLPQGKNHAIVILLDYSSSMNDDYQLMAEFIQACVFGEFCRINNIPFTIYAYGAYVNFSKIGIKNGFYKYREVKLFEEQNGVLLVGDNNNFDIGTIMWLANKRGNKKEITFDIEGKEHNFFISQNGTPTLQAVSIAYNKLKEYKKSGIEKTFLYIMTDGMYSRNLECKQVVLSDDLCDEYSFIDCTCNNVYSVENIVIDNKQYSIKQYSKYFQNAFPSLEHCTSNIDDWTFEIFLAHIKKDLGSTIVYSYVDSYKYMLGKMNTNAVTEIHPNMKGIEYIDRYTRYGKYYSIPDCYYFYKHFVMFERGTVNYDMGSTFTYNFKNNPFIDQYIFLNTDVIKNMNINSKYSTAEKIALNENTMDEYLKNNNAIIKVFEVMVRSFISIFS